MERIEDMDIVRGGSMADSPPSTDVEPIVRRTEFAEPDITDADIIAALQARTEASRTPEEVTAQNLRRMARLLFAPDGGMPETPLQESVNFRW